MAPQQPLELILLRQLASYLTVPIWMMDEAGNLIFYNEPAERLLGVRFDDAGPIRSEDLVGMFQTTDLDGEPLSQSDLPIVHALTKRVPSYRSLRICALDGQWKEMEVSAVPLEGQGGRFLGAFATLWELDH
jgi:PAS domain S-box-containing protein